MMSGRGLIVWGHIPAFIHCLLSVNHRNIKSLPIPALDGSGDFCPGEILGASLSIPEKEGLIHWHRISSPDAAHSLCYLQRYTALDKGLAC